MEKIAFCDFDGTLSDRYISMDFLDYLVEREKYSKKSYRKQINYFTDVKVGKLSYEKWCELWGREWAKGLKGQYADVMRAEATMFFHKFRQNIYPSSYKLINYLKEKGYTVMAVSLGAYEVIKLAAEDLGMDKACGTKNEIKDGIYTGKLRTNIHLPGGKEKKIKRIIRETGVSLENCIAAGDSRSDVEMLEIVGIPIVLNPSHDLVIYAKGQRWPIFKHHNVMKGIKKLLG